MRRDLAMELGLSPMPASQMLPAVGNFPSAFPAQPIAGGLPTSDVPQQDLGAEIIKTLVSQKQNQSLRGSFVQDILAKRFEPTEQDIVGANLQNTQAALLPESYKTTTPTAMATDRLGLELAPYTTMAKLKELNQPYSEAGKLMYDVQEGLVDPAVAEAQMGKGAVDIRLKEAQIKATEALASQRSQPGGAKAPAGYRFKQDGSLEAIPGGPATKLSPEAAAKVGSLETAISNLPNVRKVMSNINVLSAADWVRDAGDIGQAKRQVVQGIESALRAMSGAAVPPEEVKRYAMLYMPRFDDTPTTKKRKLDELEKFMTTAYANSRLGRTAGDDAALAQDQEPSDYSGMTDEQILEQLSQ